MRTPFVFKLSILAGLVFMLSIAGYGQNRDTTAISPQISEEQFINAHTNYIKGMELFENENYQEAVTFLSKAFSEMPGRSGIAYSLADAHFKLGDLSNAVYYCEQAIRLNPGNKWYHLKLSEIHRKSGNHKAAVKTLKSVLEHDPDDKDILTELAEAYAAQGQYMKSNDVYNRLLKISGARANIHLKKLELFDQMEMRDSAMAQLQEIRRLDPGNLSAIQALSNNYLEIGMTDKAIKLLREGLSKNGRDPKTLIMLADIYMKQSKWDSVSTILGSVVTDPVVEPDAKLTVTQYMLSRYRQEPGNRKLMAATSSLVNKFTAAEQDYANAHALAANFFISTGQEKEALDALERTNNLQPSEDKAWKQRLRLLMQEQNFDQVIEIAPLAANHVPQDPLIMYLWGSAYMAKREYKPAIEKLSDATKLPARREFKTAVYTSLADAYAGIKKWENAFGTYEQALKLNPDNHTALNNYAYHLAINDRQLEKAEQMSLRALELSGENSRATYLDTAGWVFYKKGEYQKALEYLKKSVELGDASAVIMEHLGDTYNKLNNPRKATRWWKKALEKDSSKTHLKEKINKL